MTDGGKSVSSDLWACGEELALLSATSHEVHSLLRVGGELEEVAVFGLEEAGLDYGVEEGEEGVPEVGGVDEDDGFGVEAELGPRDGLEHFFEGAVASGEDEEGVSEMDHAGLALVHGGNELEGGEGLVGDFAAGEDVREDADDWSAAGEGGVGDCAHEADRGAPVDEAEMGGGDGSAEGAGFSEEGWIAAEGGAAVDGDAAGWRSGGGHGDSRIARGGRG